MKTDNTQTKFDAMQHDTVTVVLIRHAQSQWNRENRFTGWANPPLTEAGIAEAIQAGEWLYRHGYRFDVAWSSRLQRAITTLDILLEQIGQQDIPRQQDWRLNERHYGALQGVDKAKAAAQVGEQQVWCWRRGYTDRAMPLLPGDPGHPGNDPLYADVAPHLLPAVENLAETRARVMMFWQEHVAPRIKKGERVLISAHGNTLRALLMDLAGMSVQQVEGFEIPTATPILYRFDHNGQPLDWRYLNGELDMARSA
jgi:2,3-bisphosphoglycerate-dependent phosphoglycerate mutase